MFPSSDQEGIYILYGCETLSVTFREEYRIIMTKNRVLRNIFGPKRDKGD
jgi:hypothetical protein